MVMTDPIADFLTRIRNANQAKHEVLEVPASNIKKGIAEILKREGFVKNVEIIEDPKVLNGLGIAILSTSEGLLTDKEARQKNVGGEVIAYVW